MSMELWDIYDVDRKLKDRTVERKRNIRLDAGDFHLVVHACIFNCKGQMLIQRRQFSKEGWPGRWDISVGGSALSGESSREAISRECKEELGIDIDFKDKRPHLTLNFIDGFDDIYLIKHDVDITALKLQYEEVADAKWADMQEIFDMIDNQEFIPYPKSEINLFFDLQKCSLDK